MLLPRMPPLHVLVRVTADQRPPYGAYRIPLVDGAPVTGEVMTPGWTAP